MNHLPREFVIQILFVFISQIKEMSKEGVVISNSKCEEKTRIYSQDKY
jgi:hypothetical protein